MSWLRGEEKGKEGSGESAYREKPEPGREGPLRVKGPLRIESLQTEVSFCNGRQPGRKVKED